MCGIIGYNGTVFTPDLLRRGMKILSHRGPDASGEYINSPDIAIGHLRLSVIDLSEAANQPFFNEDRSLAMVANGEIYNFGNLRKILLAKGHVFVSVSDCEVIVHGFEEWGIEGLLSRLEGMYAFCIMDISAKRFYLARDRFGIKPLYYWNSACCFSFASEIQALRAMLPGILDIDYTVAADFFTFGYVPGENAIYKGCQVLRPGHYLSWDKTGLLIQRYWTPPERGSLNLSEGDLLDGLDAGLKKCVASCFVSDRPVGVFLSSGVDSSLVAAYAAELGSKIKTFTVSFPGSPGDESAAAAGIAARLGTEHCPLPCDEAEALAIVSELPLIYGEPFADSSAIPSILLCRNARKSIVVALSGDGGDELALGYSSYENAWKARLMRVLNRMMPVSWVCGPVFPGDSRVKKLMSFIRGADSTLTSILPISAIFKGFQYRSLFQREWIYDNSAWSRLPDLSDILHCWNMSDVMQYLPDSVLTKLDRASMRFSLEVRIPLLELGVANILLPLHKKVLRRGKIGKVPLRNLLSKKLADAEGPKTKLGFSPPIARWLREGLKPLLLDMLSPVRLKEEGLLNCSEAERLIDEHLSGRKDNHQFLWTLLMWEMWRDSQKTNNYESLILPE